MTTLLDTNVLSELCRAEPSPTVLAWFAVQGPESLLVSAVTQAEMMLGARLMPLGRRRAVLERALSAMFEVDFAGRILPFDGGAVPAYVELVSQRRSVGRPITQFDAQIAAIALSRGLVLATRNGRDFEGIAGLTLQDPWAS